MIQYLTKVLYVLSGRKRELFFLFLILLLTSFLEAIGIGLIGPFIKVATTPESVFETPLLERAYQLSNVQSARDFIPLLGAVVGIVFCVKSVVYFFARSYIFHFSYTQKELLMSKLLDAYQSVPYTFHLKRNTASLIENIVIEVNYFTENCLLTLLTAITNLVITIALLLLLAKTSLSLLVLVLVSILPLFLFLKLFKDRFERWGKDRVLSNQEMIRVLNHSLGSIRETRLIGCEDYFGEQLTIQGKRFARSAALSLSSQLFPRILIESVLIVLVIAFVSYYQRFSGDSMEELIAILGVFTLTSLRLIPSTSQFIKNIVVLQNSTYTLDMLYNDLKELEKVERMPTQLAGPSASSSVSSVEQNGASNGVSSNGVSIEHSRDRIRPLPSPISQSPHPGSSKFEQQFEQQVALKSVRYRYPGTSTDALKDISMTIKKGESVAFIGKSGAGKTTLVDIIIGLLTPTAGDIQVDGKSIYADLRAWQNLVGYIPQSIFLIDDTIRRNVAFGVPDHLIDEQRLKDAIRSAQLQTLVDELPEGLDTSVGERGIRLSGGQRQRIGIARALYHEREILVLDEATSALDGETERQISDAISQLAGSKTLIIIAHRLSTVQDCDRLYMLEDGGVMKSGSYREVVMASGERG